MKCPHCNISIGFQATESTGLHALDEKQKDKLARLDLGRCPDCGKLIILMQTGTVSDRRTIGGGFPAGFGGGGFGSPKGKPLDTVETEDVVVPRNFVPRKVDREVPGHYAKDYREAVLVLAHSPKASAALSRRVLQKILREERNITKQNLAGEIEEFIQQSGVPPELVAAVDAVRNIGNFAAHPLKDTNTGEIVDVELGEAEWLIEVLDAIFDFVFVQPTRLKKRRDELNAKLQRIGKPPMK